MLFKSIMLNGVRLVVYPDGTILRYFKTNTKGYRKGWNIVVGCQNNQGYLRVQLNNKKYSLHRIIASAFLNFDIEDSSQLIDHIDRNKNNNWIDNLRLVSNQQNQFNTSAKGYTRNGNRFEARIKLNQQTIYLGLYDTGEEARNAYLEAKAKYHII
jgi:hypothetical protein